MRVDRGQSGAAEVEGGSVVALWRYPVKSMMGEELNASEVTDRGLLGDRQFAVVDASTGKVAGGAVQGDVPHSVPMLSLDNVFDADELAEWAAGLERRLGHPVAGWCVEPKLDGLAIAARYRGGKLVQGLTRGDGRAGEDITHAADAVLGLPPVLTEPIDIELRRL